MDWEKAIPKAPTGEPSGSEQLGTIPFGSEPDSQPLDIDLAKGQFDPTKNGRASLSATWNATQTHHF